jgi:hypothetical protein
MVRKHRRFGRRDVQYDVPTTPNLDRLARTAAVYERARDEDEMREVDEELRERLRSLGYVD